MSRRQLSRRVADAGLILSFLALIGLPAARNLAGSASAGTENRTLAAMPVLNLQVRNLRPFPERFEAFYRDRFGFRNDLIHWLYVAQARWLGISGSPKVIVGRSGWLFYDDVPVGCDRANRPLTPGQLSAWQRMLEARRDWLAERGIRFLFVIAPDKQSIYPEYLPQRLCSRHVEGMRLHQFLEHMHQHSNVAVVDLRGPLREAKERERLYHKTDSHWNDRGAFVASQTIVTALAPWFDGMKPSPRTAFRDETSMGFGDCAYLLSLTDWIGEERLELLPRAAPRTRVTEPSTPGPLPVAAPRVVVEQDDPHLPQALVLRDSFGEALIPFLAENFRRTVYVWQDAPTFDCDLVAKERPDVVIQEMVERKLAFPDTLPRDSPGFGPAQQAESYLSKKTRAWLACVRAE
jgi:hypothetical protein